MNLRIGFGGQCADFSAGQAQRLYEASDGAGTALESGECGDGGHRLVNRRWRMLVKMGSELIAIQLELTGGGVEVELRQLLDPP